MKHIADHVLLKQFIQVNIFCSLNEHNIKNMIALLHIHVVHWSRNKFSLLIFKIENFTQIPPRIDINSKRITILFSIFNPLVTCTNVNRWILAKTFIDQP